MKHLAKKCAPIKKRPSFNVQSGQAPWICLALAAITFVVFGQTLGHEFVNFDDNHYVYDNPMVARGLTFKGIVWAFTSIQADNWHPLTWLSHMLDCQLYGLHPGGHHLTNVLLHTATVITLFLVLRQMTGALWRSAFVAAVFAIHPLRVESVAWVAERKDVLSGLFFMLTIAAYVCYVRHPRVWWRYGSVLLLFALGLMCKPMLVTLPLVLLVLDYWPLRRAELPGKLAMEKLPLLALSIGACVATFLAQAGAMRSMDLFSLPFRLGNALLACSVYLGQMVFPAGLSVFYPYRRDGLPTGEMVLAGMLLVGFSAVAWWQRRRQPWLLSGWLWYLLMLLPVVGIIQVGAQSHADRYTYLPQIGICLAVTWFVGSVTVPVALAGVTPGSPRAKKVFGETLALPIIAVAILAILMVSASKQAAYWRNNERLWAHALACTTGNEVAHYYLANELLRKGQTEEAINHFQSALRIRPDYAMAHNNLGNAFFREGRTDEAISQFQAALELKPDFAEAHYNLGVAFSQSGKTDGAIAQYQKALQLKPDYAHARDNLGKTLFIKGRVGEAIAQYQEALRFKPDDPAMENNLAWFLATAPDASLRDGRKAVELARQANALAGGKDPVIYHTLAAAYAEVGQFSDAIQSAQQAINLAGTAGQKDLAKQFNEELKRFQAGLPLRQ
jgi:tetratricopeptide (TPR) repeat protein